jgi:RNA polymerase sigma factor (sigma-70 family)
MPTLDASRITRAIASGDTGALAVLYEQRFDRLYTIARRSTGLCEADCLDIVQESFLKIVRSIKPIENEAALDAWLARVVKSSAWDHLKHEKRLRARQAVAARAESGETSGEELDERLKALWVELSALDRGTRELIELRYRAGMTLATIGKLVGLKPGAVDGRIRRSESALRSSLQETTDDA